MSKNLFVSLADCHHGDMTVEDILANDGFCCFHATGSIKQLRGAAKPNRLRNTQVSVWRAMLLLTRCNRIQKLGVCEEKVIWVDFEETTWAKPEKMASLISGSTGSLTSSGSSSGTNEDCVINEGNFSSSCSSLELEDIQEAIEGVSNRGGTRLPSECDYLQKNFMAIIN